MHDALPPFLLIFDLDGVLYRRKAVIPDAPAVMQRLREAGFLIAFCTNNSWYPPSGVATRLERMGIAAARDEVFTSGQAAARLAASRHPGGSALVVGGPGLLQAVGEAGLTVTTAAEPESPVDVVIAGIDWDFTYATLGRAQHALLAGATFIATNLDPRYPVEEGRFLPGAGSLVAAIQAAAEVEPLLAGKPATPLLEACMTHYGRAPKESLVIGDQLATDILAGNLAGCRTALLLTGVSSREEAEVRRGNGRPTFIFDTLSDLAQALTSDELLVVQRSPNR